MAAGADAPPREPAEASVLPGSPTATLRPWLAPGLSRRQHWPGVESQRRLLRRAYSRAFQVAPRQQADGVPLLAKAPLGRHELDTQVHRGVVGLRERSVDRSSIRPRRPRARTHADSGGPGRGEARMRSQPVAGRCPQITLLGPIHPTPRRFRVTGQRRHAREAVFPEAIL
jgi:hypothetical protein